MKFEPQISQNVFIKFLLVDVTDHFEHGGEHGIHIIVGDPLLFPGNLEHTMGKFAVNGVAEPDPGVYTKKYLDRVRDSKLEKTRKFRDLTPFFEGSKLLYKI